MKRAFIVVGSESSGTRLLTRVLIQGGCYGDHTHFQKFDREPFNGEDPIVWRRSVPHGPEHRGLALDAMLGRLAKYKVIVVIIVRNWDATEKSQVAAPHVSQVHQAKTNIKRAYLSIFQQIHYLGLDYEIVTYESLVANPVRTQLRLFDRLELQGKITVSITNENTKWL